MKPQATTASMERSNSGIMRQPQQQDSPKSDHYYSSKQSSPTLNQLGTGGYTSQEISPAQKSVNARELSPLQNNMTIIDSIESPVESPASPYLDFSAFDAAEVQSSAGYLTVDDISSFKDAVNKLREATRGDAPASVLLAMKQIVVATRNIAEILENYDESRNAEEPIDDVQYLDSLKTRLSVHLTELMGLAKMHASNPDEKQISIIKIDEGSVKLTTVIVAIARILRIAGMGETASQLESPSMTQSPSRTDLPPSRRAGNYPTVVDSVPISSPGYPYEELKVKIIRVDRSHCVRFSWNNKRTLSCKAFRRYCKRCDRPRSALSSRKR